MNRGLGFLVVAIAAVVLHGCGSVVPREGQGGLDEPCYSNDTCDEPLVCVAGECVEPDEGRGGLGEPCCPNDTCDEPLVCVAGECVEPDEGRGGLGEPCYPNDTCDEPLVCVAGECVEPDEGRGGLSEPCYPHDTCDEPLVCVAGECVAAGETGDLGGPCMEDDVCNEPYVCEEGVCVEDDEVVEPICKPGERQCTGEHTYEVCDEEGLGWDEKECALGYCDGETGECVGCVPGIQYTCEGSILMVCAEDAENWELVEDCADSDAICDGGECVSLCVQAGRTNSYAGCEFWPVVLANIVSSTFHSDFAVVVSNPNEGTSADVRVYNAGGSVVASETVSGGELKVMYLPWNAMPSRQDSIAVTQKGTIAYRMESTVPVTAYQFNPLRSKIESTYSYTNDASLLLPTHVFGTASQYVAMALPHIRMRTETCPPLQTCTVNDRDMPTNLTIVATEDNTSVRLRLRGATAAGGGLGELNPGSETTVVLNRHEVLQLASRRHGNPTQHAQDSDGIETTDYYEYGESDLTGTIIDSDKPIAVYAGAECRFVPFDEWACDHMEQQLFPFQNWGSSFVGSIAEPPPGGNPNVGDLWRLVAAVDGTKVTFQPAVHGNVTLNAGDWIQFQTHQHFHVSSQGPDHPILLSQFFVGQNAHGGSMGDPTMILSVPSEQYRKDYNFITTETFARNYINVVRPTGATVKLDDQELPAGCWTNISGTAYEVCRHELDGGTYSVTAEEPIAVTVYGFDGYVSYGYPAGLDLRPIVEGEPDW